MKTVDAIASEIVNREGGYVNDPDDPGGPTKYGVTLGTLKRLRLDLTGDNHVTPADVRRLSRDRAKQIFISDYYEKPRIGELPDPLQASVFDMYVNAGSRAVKILQKLLCDMGQGISVDGVIGPQTIRAARIAHGAAPRHLVDAYGIARRNFYYSLADRRIASRKYAKRLDGGKGGWIKRAEEFIATRYHLSDAEHARRTEKWG